MMKYYIVMMKDYIVSTLTTTGRTNSNTPITLLSPDALNINITVTIRLMFAIDNINKL